ncbi:hypothetical protein CR156_16955 [Stenotrophomonas lactitubi]|nr:hypothetical protein CR156_16955 [Stenotrophomonas lactitubi]
MIQKVDPVVLYFGFTHKQILSLAVSNLSSSNPDRGAFMQSLVHCLQLTNRTVNFAAYYLRVRETKLESSRYREHANQNA